MNIIKLKPYLAQAIWGGNKLNEKYGKQGETNVAESWELSVIPERRALR
jgi:mannose-6-phosphate isomerase class I